jgi:isopentenyl-diphosphate Delta-isomerase
MTSLIDVHIDVLDANGLRTGETLSRHAIHRLGKRHRAIRLYLFNRQNELLMQQRAATVDHYPNVYGISVVGHVDAGEYSAQAVSRELNEELGLDSAQVPIEFLFSYYSEVILNESYIDRQFNDVYAARADIALDRIQFERAEVREVKFVAWGEFLQMLEQSPLLAAVYGAESGDVDYFLKKYLFS